MGVLFLLFLIQLFYYIWFYRKPLRYRKAEEKGKVRFSGSQPPVSVIIYAKNDAENLEKTLPDLLGQNYPDYEVIIVNDGSTDETKDMVSAFQTRYPNLYQTYIPEEARNLSRKKLALTVGIKAAKNEILLFTLANCRPLGREWISHMVRNFLPHIDIVLGYTCPQRHGPVSWPYIYYDMWLYAMRFLSYALYRRPYLGQGTNLAYRKSLFFKNKGFSRHLNLHFGDDDLFINEIATSTNTRAELSPESYTEAFYEKNYQAWKEQKLQYDFTRRYLKTPAKSVFAFEQWVHFLYYSLSAWLIIRNSGNLGILLPVILLLVILYLCQVLFFRYASSDYRTPTFRFWMPIFEWIRPFVNLRYRIEGWFSRGKNYTWKIK